MSERTILWAKRGAAGFGALLSLLTLFVLFCLYTAPGHGLIAAVIEPLSGGKVAIKGLTGTLPNHIGAERLEVRDSKGPWLVIENLTLDWHFWSALSNHIDVTRLAADRIAVLRLPEPSKSTSTSTTVLDVAAIALPRIELGKPVLKQAAIVSVIGALHYASRHDLAANLAIRRLDGDGRYDVHTVIADDILTGTINASETGYGIVGTVLGLAYPSPVSAQMQANAQGSANAIRFKLTADLLNVAGGGTIDLKAEQVDLDFAAVAPAMSPSPQLSWQAASAKGHIHGPFTAPDITADLKISALVSGGSHIEAVTAQVLGTGGKAHLTASAQGLVLPGDKASIFASAPVTLTADADLASPKRPIQFAINHPLLMVAGEAMTAAPLQAKLTAQIPSLAALAPLTGAKVEGNASLTLALQQAAATEITVSGTIATRGRSQIAKLLGTAKLDATASLDKSGDLSLRAKLGGAVLKAEIAGTKKSERQSFTGEVALSDLSVLADTLVGSVNLRGSLTGKSGNAMLNVQGTALAATKGMARQAITIALDASGLPKLKAANLRVAGRFDGSPVTLKADISDVGNGALKVALNDAAWRSAKAKGLITIAGNTPQGSVQLSVAKLGDLAAVTGTPLSGSLDARSEFTGAQAQIHATGQGLAAGENRIGRVEVAGSIGDPFAKPVFALTINLPDFATASLSGSAKTRIAGPLSALAISLDAALSTSDGQSIALVTDVLTDTTAKHATVQRLDAVWRDQKISLAQPASVDYADGLKFAANFVSGKATQVALAGSIGQALNVHATAKADLAAIGSGLASSGQQLRGMIAADVTVTGTTAKPLINGVVTLTGAQLRDFAHGVSLTDIEAVAEAQGPIIRLTKFSAKAGPGTVTGSGTVDLASPGMPVNIVFKASNARPMTSDLLTATIDTELTLDGRIADGLRLAGRIDVANANMSIPDKFPAQVVSLNVRHSRAKPPAPPPPPGLRIALDLTLSSRGQIFVRGRGLEAEFEGDLKISGTSLAPQVAGALSMRRGVMALGSTSLTFQSGRISFNGQSLRQRLDPSLDLLAQTEANGITATLKVTGTASLPKIELSSSPSLPQDEILAQLLFQKSMKSLSAMELAGVAQAAATLSGGGGFDPVGSVRNSLGLDRLAVGSDQSGSGGVGSTSVEAGKYVLRNVYIGAKQDFSGGTKAIVQVDITQHLKAQAQVNTGTRTTNTTSTPLHDNGDSIGLSYQFEY